MSQSPIAIQGSPTTLVREMSRLKRLLFAGPRLARKIRLNFMHDCANLTFLGINVTSPNHKKNTFLELSISYMKACWDNMVPEYMHSCVTRA